LAYVIVRNHMRGDDFGILERSGLLERAQALNARLIDLKRLRDATMLKIDAHSSSFWAATQPEADGGARFGLLERQRFRTWLRAAHDAIGELNP